MKKLFIFLLLYFVASFYNLRAQTYCLTPEKSSNMEFNKLIQAAENQKNANGPVTLRVYFHVVNNGQSQAAVEQAFDILNTDYNPHDIFFVWDCHIDFITASPFASASIFNINNHSDGIDIYLYSDNGPSNNGLANGVGSSSEFYVSGSYWNAPFGSLSLSKVISHEMGHVLFLWHTFQPVNCQELVNGSNCFQCGDLVCDTPASPGVSFNVDANCNWTGSGTDPIGDPYNPLTNNIMEYTAPDCMEEITIGQGNRARNSACILPFLTQCLVTNQPHNIVFNTTISNHQSFFNDVIVHAGVTLTVTGTMSMAQNTRILMREGAKLNVNGGTITNFCGDLWSGVRVTGGNSDFDVQIINDATIENTNAAAVSFFAPLPWPEIQNFGNGILHADNSTFNNVRRIVEFMAWSPTPNTSYVTNCTQNGGRWCITNWNCQFIQIDNNTFNDITNDCIVTETGSFLITNNVLNSGQNDILFNNVSAGIPTIVEDNQFNGSSVGYRANGTTFAQNEIISNNFQTGVVDMLNSGDNSYIAAFNDFNAFIGVFASSNGGGTVNVHNNSFQSNFVGLLTNGNNSVLNFFQNCFTTTFRDVSSVGSVNNVIFSPGFRTAENCFTHQGTAGGIQDLGGNPNPYFYLEDINEPANCRNAILAVPAVTRIDWTPGPVQSCGDDGFVEPPIGLDPCFPKKNLQDAITAYSDLKLEIAKVLIDEKLSDEEKEIIVSILRRCLKKVLGIIVNESVLVKEYDQAREWLQEDTSTDGEVLTYSTYIMEGSLEKAKNYLLSMSTETEASKDFITVQEINLDRLPKGPFYKPSEKQLSTILEIGKKEHPYAAYARALYYALTYEVIEIELPDLELEQAKPQANSIQTRDDGKEDINCFPNPFSSDLTFDIHTKGAAAFSIYNGQGEQVLSNEYETGVHMINTNHWAPGVYFVLIEHESGTTDRKKVVLIK